MFEGPNYPGTLDNDQFAQWLENGRQSKISYTIMLIVWDELDAAYKPIYLENRDEMEGYNEASTGHESLLAAYDIYSESRLI